MTRSARPESLVSSYCTVKLSATLVVSSKVRRAAVAWSTVNPRRSGSGADGSTPVDTSMVTDDPCRTTAPASGLWVTTTPAGSTEGTWTTAGLRWAS